MTTNITTVTFNGIEVTDVDIQVHISPGVPNFTVVGLADKTIAESRERVRAAIESIGLSLPAKKIIVNLAPADLLKEGSHFDLGIACALLASMGVLPLAEIKEYLILGELSLNGVINPIAGVLPASMGALARNKGIICPEGNGVEAAWSGNSNILAPNNLIALINHFRGEQVLPAPEPKMDMNDIVYPDISDIYGQEAAKRSLEIAAAGAHSMLMMGPPGAGKSMLAKRLPGILPPMNAQEILECSTIASVAGLIRDGRLTRQRPFRAPHHSCTMAALVGGGIAKRVKPGEISLAHNGVLFLDELPEFGSSVLDALRQPLESREVSISRSNNYVQFPANFQFIAAMNPCKCGYLTDPSKTCNKAPKCGQDYQNKISGPIMDRFDIHIEVPAANFYDSGFTKSSNNITSSMIASQVAEARRIQQERFDGYGIRTNAELDGQILIDFAMPNDKGKELLNNVANKFKFSMRGYNRVLRVARTIADLDGSRLVYEKHIAEAISYRQLDYRLKMAG